MSDTTRPSTYSAVAKALHWLIAAMLIAQFVGGKFMTHLSLATDEKFFVYQMHKSFGFVVLALSLYRLYWRLSHPIPALPEGMKPLERRIAPITHWLFYGFMILIPLSGWLYVSTQSGIDTKIFFLIPVFHFPLPEDGILQGWLENAHAWIATAMIGLLVLHVGAALKHHYRDGDRVFLRMLPVKDSATGKTAVPMIAGVLGVIAMSYLVVMFVWGEEEPASAPTPAVSTLSAESPEDLSESPHVWVIDPELSFVELRGQAFGAEKIVRLNDVDADILLDPDDPAATGLIDAVITMTTADSGDSITNTELFGSGWFNVTEYPTVRFTSEDISGVDGAYVANGTLTIKEVSQPLSLPFALVIDGDRAAAEGEITLDRQAYDLGGSGSGVSPNVTVTVRIEAVSAN